MMNGTFDGCGPFNSKKNGIKVKHEGVTKIISIGLWISKYLYFEVNNRKYNKVYKKGLNRKYSVINDKL